MDSVSQFALGAAVTVAALGDRAPAWRAAVYGGVLGTLPDLDVLLSHGDAIQDMTRHRAESHALLWGSLAAPLVALVVVALHRERGSFWRWWWAAWLAFVTHALLDALTIYGTQLWLPFSDAPVAVGSLFVIDPLYTLPLLVGVFLTVRRRGRPRARRWNGWGLALSTAYAAWSLVAQQLVTAAVQRSLDAAGLEASRLVVTPAPLQTLLWRAVAVSADGERAYEGYASVLDDAAPIVLHPIPRRPDLLSALDGFASPARLRWFADDLVKAERVGDDVLLTDLRMGAEPAYVFTFRVATVAADGALRPVERVTRLPFRPDARQGLGWMWRRMWGARAAPPR